jgi:hypothetical protein
VSRELQNKISLENGLSRLQVVDSATMLRKRRGRVKFGFGWAFKDT